MREAERERALASTVYRRADYYDPRESLVGSTVDKLKREREAERAKAMAATELVRRSSSFDPRESPMCARPILMSSPLNAFNS